MKQYPVLELTALGRHCTCSHAQHFLTQVWLGTTLSSCNCIRHVSTELSTIGTFVHCMYTRIKDRVQGELQPGSFFPFQQNKLNISISSIKMQTKFHLKVGLRRKTWCMAMYRFAYEMGLCTATTTGHCEFLKGQKNSHLHKVYYYQTCSLTFNACMDFNKVFS